MFAEWSGCVMHNTFSLRHAQDRRLNPEYGFMETACAIYRRGR